jgi:phosphoheptose isomerase
MRREAVAHIDALLRHHPVLGKNIPEIRRLTDIVADGYRQGGSLFTCGNGGSAADADHMVGELMKRFRLPRPLPADHRARLSQAGLPEELAGGLETGLRAIWLGAHMALATAVANDTDPGLVFAQPLYVLAREGDVVLALSTSGNSANVIHALRVGRALGLKTLGLTGAAPCLLDEVCDLVVHVPARETHVVQELHQPTIHAICLALEEEFFGAGAKA